MWLGFALAAAVTGAGPISALEQRLPMVEVQSSSKLEEVERCMLNTPHALVPTVYQQPDRPDDAMLLWMASPSGGGLPIARVDLSRTSSGTRVRMWVPPFRHPDELRACAPQ